MFNNNIPVGNFLYTLDTQGNWTFKAKEPEALTKKGVLKAQYKELPRFNLIYDIDDLAVEQMTEQIESFVKDFKKLLK